MLKSTDSGHPGVDNIYFFRYTILNYPELRNGKDRKLPIEKVVAALSERVRAVALQDDEKDSTIHTICYAFTTSLHQQDSMQMRD